MIKGKTRIPARKAWIPRDLTLAPAQTAHIIVNSTSETPVGPNICTLREAILAFNTQRPVNGCGQGATDFHTIELMAGTYTFTSAYAGDAALPEPHAPDGNNTLSLLGAGRDQTIIERDVNAPGFGLMHGAFSNTLGIVLGDANDATKGLTLRNFTNTAIAGGRFALEAHACSFDNNSGTSGVFDYGGGFGSVVAENCVFTNNHGTGNGGATSSINATLLNSTFTGNTAAFGGAVSTANYLEVRNCVFSQNSSTAGGGALTGAHTIIVSGSSFTQNHAGNCGGGAIAAGTGCGGGAALTITNSSFFDNSVNGGGGGAVSGTSGGSINGSTFSGNQADVGGALSLNGTFDVHNVTVTGNTAQEGGGIHYSASSEVLTLNNVTLAGNSASVRGGGLFGANASVTQTKNSIIATNTAPTGPDCYEENTSIVGISSLGYNLIGNNADFQFGSAIGDQVGTPANPINPLLGPLQDNGGPTKTRALLAGSPAIDAASPSTPGTGGDSCELTDPRGIIRPQDGNGDLIALSDIGAFEADTSCSFNISPTDQNFTSAGGAGSFTVTAGGGCAWTAVSNSPFITISQGSESGTGNGTVNYQVAADTGLARTGTITIADQTFTVSQTSSTATALTVSPDTADEGQDVTFTATVSALHVRTATVGGTVVFKEGETTLGEATLAAGVATFTTKTLAAGIHEVRALFQGNTAFDASESSPVSVTIRQGPAVINVTEQISVTDAPALLPSALIRASENISVQDAPALLPSAMIGVEEQVRVQDEPTLQPSAMIEVGENIRVEDAPALQPAAMIGVQEKISVQDSAALLPSVMLNVPENISVSDTPTIVPTNATLPTPIGSNVTVQSGGVSLTFQKVTSAGVTTITPISPAAAGQLPGGYELTGSSLAFEIKTTATFTGSITICFTVSEVKDLATFLQLRVLHYENGALVDRTLSQDYSTKMICARVYSLSPFVIARLASTPRTILQDLLNQLKALRSAATSRDDQQKLNLIIRPLADATDAGYWIDASHLTVPRGKEAFDKIKDALTKLSDLMKDKKSAIQPSALQPTFMQLWATARLLAQTAISSASTSFARAVEVAKASEEFAQGDALAAAGRYDESVNHYREAWQHAQ